MSAKANVIASGAKRSRRPKEIASACRVLDRMAVSPGLAMTFETVPVAEILGLIPARGGSKGIPHKNLASLGGKPLVAYTCECAFASRRLTRVVLNTDDLAIAGVGRTMGVEIPFLRPPELGRDETPVIDVVLHTLAWFQEHEDYRPDAVVLLQPTSPLRRSEHVDTAVEVLLETGADSVVSVVPVPHQFHPVSLMKMEDGRLFGLESGPGPARRQDKPILYARNGPAVLAVRRNVLIEQHSLYGEDCRPLVMGPEESVDIDGPQDLLLAEFLLARYGDGFSGEEDLPVAQASRLCGSAHRRLACATQPEAGSEEARRLAGRQAELR